MSSYYEDTNSLYESQKNLTDKKFEDAIEWICDKTLHGVDLTEIKII